MYREQGLLEFFLYLLPIGIIGQGETAHKSAVAAFDAVELPFLLFLLELAFAGNSQHAVFDCDFYVLFFELGQLGLDQIFFLIFGDVSQWHPIGERDFFPTVAVGAALWASEKSGETVLKVFHFSERLPAS